jgi:hypothetical protein
MRASLEGSPRSVLSFRLPESYLLVGVNATEMKDWFVTAEDDANPRTLTIELNRPMTGKVETVLQGYMVKDAADFLLELRFPEPLEISSMKSAAIVMFDESYKPTVTNSESWEQVDVDALPAELRKKQTGQVKFGFTSESVDDKMIEFEIAQVPPKLTTNAVVITTVGDTFVEYAFYLDWRIAGPAVDRFTFDAPRSLDGRLKIVVPHPTQIGKYMAAPRVREVQTADAAANLTRWTVTLKRPIKDRYLALAVATVPIDQNQIQSPRVTFVEPVFDEFGDTGEFAVVAQQQLFAILANPSIYRLSPNHGAAIELVNADRLPIKLPKAFVDQAVEILRVQDPRQTPTWTVKKLEKQAGAPASVNVADLTLVLANDGTWRTQAVYTIRNRRRQFLALKLPENARMLSVFVGDRPSRPVLSAIDNKPIHLIALPKSSAADTSFTVNVVCAGSLKNKLPSGFSFDSQEIDLPAPHVVSQKESNEYGIPVARTLWTIYVPKDIDATFIDDSTKSNLKRIDENKTEIQDAYAKAMLQDLSSGNAVMESDDASLRQQEFAARNFEDLNENLTLFAENTKDEKTREIIVKEQKKFLFNQKRIQDSARRNQNVSGTKIERQLQLIAGNNRSILLDNSISITESPLDESEETSVESATRFRLGSQPSGQASAKPGTSPVADGRKTSTRTKKHQQSRSNLDDLNSRIAKQNELFSDSSKQLGGGMLAGGRGLPDDLGGTQPQDNKKNPFGFEVQDSVGRPIPSNRLPKFGIIRGDGANRPGRRTPTHADLNEILATFDASFTTRATGEDGLLTGGYWSQVGGLSLAIDIPKNGTELKFTKVSGQPKLALQLRSRELLDTGLGFIWTIVWIGIGVVLLVTFGRVGQTGSTSAAVAVSLFAAGLASFVVLPNPLSSVGFVAFVVGASVLAVRFARSGKVVDRAASRSDRS